jgi:hypothetical protein
MRVRGSRGTAANAPSVVTNERRVVSIGCGESYKNVGNSGYRIAQDLKIAELGRTRCFLRTCLQFSEWVRISQGPQVAFS